jgi:chromosome segregation ATPase
LTEETAKENLTENSSEVGNQIEKKTAEFEKVIASKESEIAALKKSESELQEKLSAVSKSLAEAVASYKARVIQVNPEITEELISCETIGAVDDSLEKAINLISRVKKSVEKEISHTRVPAGAPGRHTSDLSALSPREKIQYAIGGKK